MLYIDDLDRCPSDRVMKGAPGRAPPSSLSFVRRRGGVDSRWLLRSLRHEYSDLLVSSGDDSSSEDEAHYWESTPQNYLEKIFQIPYWIRPMEPDGYVQLVRSLVAADTESDAAAPATGSIDGHGDSASPESPAPGGAPSLLPLPAARVRPSLTVAAASATTPVLEDPAHDSGRAGEQRLAPAPPATVADGQERLKPPVDRGDLAVVEEPRAAPRNNPVVDLTPRKLIITPKERALSKCSHP